MKFNRFVAMLLALAMMLSLAACTGTTGDDTAGSTNAPETTAPQETDPIDVNEPEIVVEDGNVSIDFEDGNYGFASVYSGRANADASTLEVVEKHSNKALKVTNGSGKVPYVAFDVVSLLGDNAANVRTVEMTMGIENPDGTFYACSGNLILWTGEKLSTTTYGWSVYLETKNPKAATFTLADYEAFSAENPVMVVTLDTDNGATAGVANANLFIYNITFKDADGNVLTADSTASFVEPNGFGGSKDMSNLKYLAANAVSFDAMSGVTGSAWGQNGFEMTDEFVAALVPGAIIEIEYSSTTGDLWIVMPWAAAGWMRINADNGITPSYNNSKNIVQITYEQIAQVCGDDVSTWGSMLQCESSGDWQVYSVKIAQDSGLVSTAGKTALDGFTCSGDGWAQNGFELTADQLALLVPGSIIEVSYTSESGNLWAVMPWAAAGWMRINADNGTTPICNGETLQVTYEQIAAICGDDASTWGTMLQFESDTAWEVYAVSICSGTFASTGAGTLVEGFACSEGAWTQAGFELTADQWALFAPGTVMTVQYTSTTGNLWAVLPWAAAGWMRINGDNGITPICDGETLQVTYEQIAQVCGEDVSTWGTMLQFESDDAWEVYSVTISPAN